ncbi:SDR family oxidoreductase [Aliterella atlantica]|uniref:Short-chain dehydrogenase n=1 Tax=Aliterella atlantica CENA595 TaxID=1618023 RepID=A0A0D8ZNA7_9CYAN|nr:SDR family oxidoreductase [Aliterella atlantica]KJH69964.1 short-chain dehydrogenase [Aliterella atlantica CENA595]
MTTLTNKTAIVTGASSGIGRAIALNLAQEGAVLCLVGRNLAALEDTRAIASQSAPQVTTYAADLSNDNDLRQLTEYVQALGQVDVLVHSAGVFKMGKLADSAIADFDLQYQINVRAPYLLTQALLPMLLASHGQIVFINSSAGLNAKANVGQYAASKFALKAIADSLREEVNAAGVRVLSVFPGRTASPMQAAIYQMEGKTYHPDVLLQPEDVARTVVTALSLPPTAEVTDINIRPSKKT